MRRPLIAGNWKMNGTAAEAEALLTAAASAEAGRAELVVCPPFTSIGQAAHHLTGTCVQWGAQNVYPAPSGAYTGEISPRMLKALGCRWCICGHSERRQLFGETDEFVSRKVRALLDEGITPILCVGETAEERRDGRTAEVVQREVEAGLGAADASETAQMVIAYEPVWAIGAGQAATAAEAEEVAAWIRECIFRRFGAAASEGVRILYGGSVGGGNIASFLAEPDIDGALIGGASLRAEEFISIYNTANA